MSTQSSTWATYHRLAALLIGLAGLKALLRDGDGLIRIEYLDVELGYLLEHVVGCDSRIEACLLCSELIQLDSIGVLSAVSHSPVARQRVRTVVIHLLHVCLNLISGNHCRALFRPRIVAYIL